MAGSKASLKKASGNAVVSDSESEYREDAEIAATTTMSSSSKRSSSRRSRATTRRPSSSNQHHHPHHHHIKHYVEHNYHDHKHDPIEMMHVEHGMPTTSKRRTGHRGGVSTPFPDRLHELLESVAHQGREDVISWQPHGRAFVVHKPKEFVSEIMPQFFKQSKLTSFQRQLNLYGFARLTTGPDRNGYYHELFIRGRSDLCSRMVRTRVKGNGSKAAASPSTEPNFYNMEPCLAEDAAEVIKQSPPMAVDEVADSDMQLFHEKDLEEDLSRVETPEPLPSGPDVLIDEDSITPVSRAAVPFWTDDREGFLGTTFDMGEGTNETKFTSLPPVVTPVKSESRKVFRAGVPPMLPMVASLDSLELPECSEGIHSGDQVFFEGLPFHYLELRDVEESLVQVHHV